MNKSKLRRFPVGLLSILLAGGTFGCVGGAVPNLIEGEEFELPDVLSRLVAGDVGEAFQQFRGALLYPADDPDRVMGLTPEQRAEIETLQGKLDSGEITPQEFVANAWQILGDMLPNVAFAGADAYGSPFGFLVGGVIADSLQLDEQQRRQATAIVTLLGSDVRGLRQDARGQILSALTADQRAALPFVDLLSGTDLSTGNTKLQVAMLVFDALVEQLDLTEEQQAQITIVRTILRDGVKGLHESAREQFLMMLVGEQPSILAALETK